MSGIWGALAALGAVLVAIVVNGAPGAVNAATVSFAVQASGANEVPAVSSGGAANAQFHFDDETNELRYSVAIVGLSASEVTAAHIHRGAAGENGPIAYPLAEEGFVQIAGSVTLSDEDVALLMAGELYLNVHSEDFPGGFARGQLILPEVAASDDSEEAGPTAEPEGTEEVAGTSDVTPPSTGDAGLAESGGTGWVAAAVLLTLIGGGSTALLVRSRA